MRKRLLLLLPILLVLVAAGFVAQYLRPAEPVLTERERYSLFLQQHEYNQPPHTLPDPEENEAEESEENEADRPDLAWQQDFLRTMDPALGRPAPERLTAIIQQINHGSMYLAPGAAATPWIERGPNNVGGRTRALVWDPNDVNGKKVWAGGVTGGLWYNNDITSGNSPWIAVDDFWNNISVTCIAFDPINSQTMYVGTGEGWGSSPSTSRGAGIWKSTDGGATWTQLASTTGFFYLNDIVVRNESGTAVVYAAVDANFANGSFHGTTTIGLQRSVNGGTSWSQVMPNIPSMSSVFVPADIELSANNRIWIGTRKNPFGLTDRGGGRILYSDNGTTWTTSNTTSVTNGYGRVELACAPSNNSIVYAVVENNNTVIAMKQTTDNGANWNPVTLPVDADSGIPSADMSRGQAWYDLILAVDPNNAANVVIGAVDLFRSTNSGTSWSQISKWSNNNNLASLTCSLVHADQHALTFKPGSSSTLLVGNDGGIYYTNNLANAATVNVFASRNRAYNVTQFYSCAMHPAAGVNQYLAGAQDNGTQRFTSSGMNSTTEVYGGDGAYCFIDQTNPSVQIAAYVYNSYYRSTNGGASFTTTLNNDQSTGKFINPADYDDNQHILYSSRNNSSITRIRNITTSPTAAETVSITGLADNVSHIRVSPYTTGSSTLFLGTDAGSIFKVTTADGTPTATNITGTGLPTGTVSCIEIGANENELLVTYYNYGITSVFYTSNGGTNWVSKEGNLPDMPIRWALFNPGNRNEVILATELGVWSTTNFNNASPTWSTSNSGLSNVRVDMLQIRSSDNQVIAATHGRGLFSCNAFATTAAPVAGFVTSNRFPCMSDTIQLLDTSLNYPTSWNWSITPNTFAFASGSSASSKNPRIYFTAPGSYSVTLTATNTTGNQATTLNAHITAGGFTPPFTENWESTATSDRWTIDNPDMSTTWALSNVSGNGSSTKAMTVNNFSYSDAVDFVERDGLISPPIRLVGFSSASMTFKYAYRRVSTTLQDSLAVYVSTDCGGSWTRVASFRETQASSPFVFITNANTSANYIASTTADWCGNTNFGSCKTINLNAFAGNVIRIKFENITGVGNNIYLDDISITGTQALTPTPFFKASNTTPCVGANVTFTDSTLNAPTGWTWTFTPSTVTFQGGTSASSQHPIVSFNAAGNYAVKLRATNTAGSDSLTRSAYINVQSSVMPTISVTANDTDICPGDSISFTTSITNGGSNPVYQWKVGNTVVGTNSSTYKGNGFNNNDTVTCTLTSNAACASQTTVTSVSRKISVRTKPAVSFVLPTGKLCNADTNYVLVGGTPGGGVYSGSGVTSGIFNPTQVGVGSYLLSYKITDGFGCTNSTTDTMTVNPLPTVTFSLPNDNFCFVDTTVTLSGGLPAGGTYSGPGVSNNQFKPLLLGPGAYRLTYTFTNANGCTGQATDSVFVNALPTVSLNLNTHQICQSDTILQLSGGTPAGGVFTGTGVSGSQFRPLQAPVGMVTITYSVTNAKGCKNKALDSIQVIALPTVGLNLPVKIICQSDTLITLGGGSPGGGVFSGTGVSGSQFNPSLAGAGFAKVQYTFTSAQGCKNKATDSIQVNPLPATTLNLSFHKACLKDTLLNLLGGLPSGGTYSGPGVTNNQFNPNTVGSGYAKITYRFTNVNGCTKTATDSILVEALPPVTFVLGNDHICAKDTTLILTGGSPTGGVYSGTGVQNDNQFKPALAGAGNHLITYTYSSGQGCIAKSVDTMYVNALPAKPTVINNSGLHSSVLGSAYQWLMNGQVLSGKTDSILPLPLPAGSNHFQVRVFNSAGCSNTSDSLLVVIGGLNNLLSAKNMQVFPNPSGGPISISLEVIKRASLQVVVSDLAGKEVYRTIREVNPGKCELPLQLQHLADGSYLIRLEDGTGSAQQIVVIRR